MSGPLVALAAGGTGGHVFPAEALAQELMGRGFRLALVTDRRGQAYGGTLGQIDVHRIHAGGIAGRSLLKRAKAMLELALGAFEAASLLKRLAPAAVIGFGGYASVPTMLAASLAKRPTLLHEQNAVLGRANRLLAGRVSKIATSFAETRMVPEASGAKVVHVGMPVREPVLAARAVPYAVPAAAGPIEILVLGGSQGARIFSSVVPAALNRLAPELKSRIRLSQQCRPEDLETARAAYVGSGIEPELAAFFKDVPERLARAHVVITRSGASTVAELTAVGRPAILVPYAHAIDDHQTANAHALDEAGGGWLIPEPSFTPEALAGRLAALFEMPAALEKAAQGAKAFGRPDAARKLADLVAELAGKGERP